MIGVVGVLCFFVGLLLGAASYRASEESEKRKALAAKKAEAFMETLGQSRYPAVVVSPATLKFEPPSEDGFMHRGATKVQFRNADELTVTAIQREVRWMMNNYTTLPMDVFKSRVKLTAEFTGGFINSYDMSTNGGTHNMNVDLAFDLVDIKLQLGKQDID